MLAVYDSRMAIFTTNIQGGSITFRLAGYLLLVHRRFKNQVVIIDIPPSPPPPPPWFPSFSLFFLMVTVLGVVLYYFY